MSNLVNSYQVNYIKKLETNFNSNSDIYNIPGFFPVKLQNLYIKPVIVVAPDISFPNCILKCTECDERLCSKGWSDSYRYCHSIKSGVYILQKRYACKNKSCNTMTIDGLSYLIQNYKKLDSILQAAYPLVPAGDTVFSRDLCNLLIGDCLSSKTFDEIKNSIINYRMAEYSNKRAIYYAYYSNNSNTLIDLEPFSSFCNKDGYNEIGSPDVTQLIDYFNTYCKDRKQYFDACLSSIKPHKVLSIDGTYHIQNRTKVI